MKAMPARESHDLIDSLKNNHIQSLKSLCALLLREVEMLTVIKPEADEELIGQKEISLADEVERFEINLIKSALSRTGGNQTKASQILGIKLTTLHAKVKKYGICATDFTAFHA